MVKVDELKQRSFKQSYIATLIVNAKTFFTSLADFIVKKVTGSKYSVEVTNPNTEVLLEVAKNTRGVKGAIRELSNKEQKINVNLSKVEVSNLSELKNIVKEPKVNVVLDKIAVTNISDATKNLKSIEISNLKDIKQDNSSLESALNAIKSAVLSIGDYLPSLRQEKQDKIEISKLPKVELKQKELSFKEGKEIVTAIDENFEAIKKGLTDLYQLIERKDSGGSNNGGQTIVSSGKVTDININGLRGIPKSTAVTVSTTATQLPSSNLSNRRSVIIYNNSSSLVYIGGEDVTVANGLPVQVDSYSPPIDAGQTMDLYAVVSSGSSEVRVLEVSSEKEAI